jgi:hypothetical protein
MNTMSRYPSKRPSVDSVKSWDNIFEESADTWKGQSVYVKVERGFPFPDFYRVTYSIDSVKKSKLFYGESAHTQVEVFVYDIGIYNVSGMI